MKITERQIVSSTNGYKPVDYTTEKVTDKGFQIRLRHTPDHYYFREFMSIEFYPDKKTHPLEIHGYDSREEMDKGNSEMNISLWSREDCGYVLDEH